MPDRKAGSIQKAIDIISAFSESCPQMTLADLHRKTRIPKPTLLRICEVLTENHLLYRDEVSRVFRLGFKTLHFGNVYRCGNSSANVVLDLLSMMASKLRESVSLYKLQDFKRRCLLRVSGPQSVHHHIGIGDEFDLHLGAGGTIILANLNEEQQRAYCSTHVLPDTFASTEAFMAHLRKIRKDQFVISRGERDVSLAAAAVPVFWTGGQIFGSLAVSGPIERLPKHFGEKEKRLLVESGKMLAGIVKDL